MPSKYYLACEITRVKLSDGTETSEFSAAVPCGGRHYENPKVVHFIVQECNIYKDKEGNPRGVMVNVINHYYPNYQAESGLALVDIRGESFVRGPRMIVPSEMLMSYTESDEDGNPLKPGPDREAWMRYHRKGVDEYNRLADCLSFERLPYYSLKHDVHETYKEELREGLGRALKQLCDLISVEAPKASRWNDRSTARLDRLVALYMSLRLGLSQEPEYVFDFLLKSDTERRDGGR